MNERRTIDVPTLYHGALSIDDRGTVASFADFPILDKKRFFTISDHTPRFVRAWHAHRKEARYFSVVRGAAVVAAVLVDDWASPSSDAKPQRFVLAAERPSILYIPTGYAYGTMTLTAGTQILVFSTATLEESAGDEFIFDSRYWDVWDVPER